MKSHQSLFGFPVKRVYITKAKWYMRLIAIEKIKNKNHLWLLYPMQLFRYGQWWSNLSTHLLQIFQCLLRGVRITLHSGQRLYGSTFCNKYWKEIFGSDFKYPGSNIHPKIKAIIINKKKDHVVIIPISLYSFVKGTTRSIQNNFATTIVKKKNIAVFQLLSIFVNGNLTINQLQNFGLFQNIFKLIFHISLLNNINRLHAIFV